MNPYDRYLLPWIIDKACGTGPIQKKRSTLVPRAHGRVLEVGVGTGHNLPFYDADRVSEVIALDPAEQMHRRARARAAESGIDVRVLGLPAETIPLDDDEVDTVVMTFTLCTIPDPTTALAEMRRVLKPGGELLFCEHGAAPDADVQKWQRRLNPIQNRVGGGCNINRDISGLIGQSFEIAELDEGYSPGPKFASYLYYGAAN
ncbi:class I SAM-dependent methyltransferase [Nocardioides humilatus]|uniref:Class I SAM-dependent methyltransferase n=1 Tax=Nocardioides humilatus TaxID=2607660 RepID=A0A5B1LM72_9ACTN|nr:class I SAM-dependent methyltransferase [Nocardioides humilatus]KAA1421576.1 class I SAM-dependent methyltransferase [Nocardioides humilatus]